MAKTKKSPARRIVAEAQSMAIDILPSMADLMSPDIMTDPKGALLKIGQMAAGSVLKKFAAHFKKLQAEKIVKEDSYLTSKPQTTLLELLKFLEQEVPDEERIKAMQSIFFKGIEKDADAEAETWAYELMSICKQLSGPEILILKATYEWANELMSNNVIAVDKSLREQWLQNVADRMGNRIPSFVEAHEAHLEDLALISKRRLVPQDPYQTPRTFIQTPYYRLTDLGYKLCQFITAYKLD